MLVLSQDCGNSIIITDGVSGFGCLLTVLGVREDDVRLLISSSVAMTGFDAWTTTLGRDHAVRVGSQISVSFVDVRHDHARLGIVAPKGFSVHRLEVWEAIRRETRRPPGDEDDDGSAGSRVPRPGGPMPPSLDVRLNPPPAGGV